MFYEISRGMKTGRQLTTAQRTSPRFAEEPVVMGKVLRRGSAPVVLTDEQFRQNRVPLIRLLAAGAVDIMVLDGIKRVPFRLQSGGVPETGLPASAPVQQAEEPEAQEPPSSRPVEAPVEEPVVEEPVTEPSAAPAEDVEQAPVVAEPPPETGKKKGRRG
jgi:hypothetical protein